VPNGLRVRREPVGKPFQERGDRAWKILDISFDRIYDDEDKLTREFQLRRRQKHVTVRTTPMLTSSPGGSAWNR
jgi:hypothetical protein